MGHHLDDFVETAIINQCFHSRLYPMKPVQEFFDGKIKVIRPMIEVHESVTRRLANEYNLPVIKPVCPYDQTNIRAKVKPIVRELVRLNSLSREHIYDSFNLKG